MKILRSLVRFSSVVMMASAAFLSHATESAAFHVDTRNLALFTNTVNGVKCIYFKTGSDATLYDMGFAACRSSSSTVEVPSEVGGCTVRALEYRACRGQNVQKLILPATVTNICRGAFSNATSLQGVYFLGNKPTFDARALEGANANLTFYVRAGMSGWTDAEGSLPATLTTGDGSSRNLRYCWALTLSPTANGSISGAAGGWYPDGATVSLTATPATGYLFLRWTGDLDGCTLADASASVVMTADRTIGAEFTEDVYPPTLEAKSGETRLEWNLVVGEEGDAAYIVSNPYHGTQSGLQVALIGCPATCALTYTMPDSIAADSDAMLVFRAKALAASPSSAWETFTVRVTTAEGASIDIPAAFHAASERAALTTVEERLVSTMELGAHTEVSFTLVNDTGVGTGRIHLDFTPYGWLSLVGSKTLPALAAGESRTVTLALDPSLDGDWTPGVALEGTVTFSCEEGTGGSIPFAFTPVTESTGSIRVICKDNSGENATYVPLAGASISLLDAETLAEVASGTSDGDGICVLSDLAVGRYVIGVTATDHDTYKAVVRVRAGEQTEVRALLDVAIVTGRAEFKWVEIEDEYVLVYTPQIVHVVPAPNVEWTLSPRVLAEGATTIVQMHVKNTGLVRATSVTFAFPAYPAATHHIAFSANGFALDPGEERDVTVRFVCDDAACRGTGANRAGYATMKVGYTSSDPETGESKTVGYCDGKVVLHGNVPEPTYEAPELVFVVPVSDGAGDSGDKRTYDPDYELLNSGRVVFRTGDFEASEKVEWPKIARPDAVVPVTLEIKQPVSLKRDVIEGSFVFSNKSETAEAYIHLDIKIQNEAGEDCRNLFTIVATNTANDGSVPLDGERLRAGEVSLAALREGRAGYWFVPTRDAAPTESVDYYFGGSFVYRIGTDGTLQTNDLLFCKMTVSPMPYLKMDYFTQRDVFSDNPFTDVTEAYQPAEFALRVRNEGAGAAKGVRISSSRPEIITNESHLVVDYDLRNWSYASYLNGTSTTLDLDTVNLGTIPAGKTSVAEWLFVSTLEGHFTTNGHARLEYTMPWQNSETTQISEDVGVHLLVHRCQADSDGVVDFLTSEKSTGAPDKLWRSSSSDPVAVSTNAVAEIVGDASLSGSRATLTVRVTAAEAGPVYVSAIVNDAKTYRVSALALENGTALPQDNAWTTDRTFVPTDLTTAFGSRPIREGRIHLFDTFGAAGTRTYVITLEPRFAYVIGDEEGGHRVGETYAVTVPTETLPCAMMRSCTGWRTLSDGVETASGTTNEVSFTLLDAGPYETVLQWSTNWWISVTNVISCPLESVSNEVSASWYEAGTTATLRAEPLERCAFKRWTGDTAGCVANGETLEVPADRTRAIVAEYERVLLFDEALDATNQTWTTGGAREWTTAWDTDAPDGRHSARIDAIANNTNAWIETTVEGAGTVSFSWRSELAGRNTKLQFYIDGETKGLLQYTNGWTTVEETIYGKGTHTLRWRLFTGRSGAAAGDVGALDAFLWTPAVPPTLAEALNASLAWTTEGDLLWEGLSRDSLLEEREAWAAIAGLGDSETAAIETRVYGKGTLSFDWWVSCEGEYDALSVSVDGTYRADISGEVGWKTEALAITGEGWHTVRWEFMKDEYDDEAYAGSDEARLDNVAWTSEDGLPPSIDDDPDADITGNRASGFVIRPSRGRSSVVVQIPSETQASNVTVEIDAEVKRIAPHGAKMKIMREVGGVRHDIADYIDLPSADASGAIDLTQAKVKEEVVRDALDTGKSEDPAVVSLDPANPTIRTSKTKPGLTYTFSEGTSLDALVKTAEKQGDGTVWEPPVKTDESLKSSSSRFFSIGVSCQ